MEREDVGVRDLLDCLGINVAAGVLDVRLRLYEVRERGVDHVGPRRVVVGAGRHDRRGLVKQSLPFVAESEGGSVSH